MYKEHPNFKPPHDEHIRIWRYVDFTKLLSLIDTRRLFFTRADKFEDPFEGSWPKINVDARKELPAELPKEKQEPYLKEMAKMGKISEQCRRFIAISCWHENAHESAAMWKLYLKSDEGIAIQSTFHRLKRAIIDEEDVYLGKVKYIDYEKEYIDADNLLNPFVHKRKSFIYEQEIRGLVTRWPSSKDGTVDFTQNTIENGVPIKIDLETLIENVFIAPNAPKWFAELVDAVIKRYGYNFNVVHSQMNNSPLF